MSKRMQVRQERGQSVAEFALVLPLMMLVLLGIVQFGMVFKQYITLTDAVREGAQGRGGPPPHRPRQLREGVLVVTAGGDLGSGFTTGNVSVTSTWNHGEDVVVRATMM